MKWRAKIKWDSDRISGCTLVQYKQSLPNAIQSTLAGLTML